MSHGRKRHHGLRYSLAYAALAVCVTACSSGSTVASTPNAAGHDTDPACPATPVSPAPTIDEAEPSPVTELQCKKARSEQFKVASIYSPGRAAVTKDGSRIVVGSFSDGWLEVGERTRLPSGWDNDETGGSGFVIKYDVAGNATWVKKFDSQPFARVPFVSTDDGGNIYVAGYVMGPLRVDEKVAPNEEYFDLYVAKLDPHGKLLWTSFGGNSDTRVYALAADATGNTYITGMFERSMEFGGRKLPHSGAPDMFLIKHGPDGRLVWAKQFGGVGRVLARHLAVDAGGNVFVTGTVGNDAQFDDIELESTGGAFLAKFDPSGSAQWVRGTVSKRSNEGEKVAVSPQGDVYLVGDHYGDLSFGDGVSVPGEGTTRTFVAKYDGTGTAKWARNAYERDRIDLIKDLQTNRAGDVYVLASHGLLGFTSDNREITMDRLPEDLKTLTVDTRDRLHLTYDVEDEDFDDDDDDNYGFVNAWARCQAK